MLAAGAIPIISDLFQYLLDGLGWVLARIYDVVPNYGLSIIVLTLIIRFVLFPLGMKQIKSMQHMQAIQPKIKEIQKKHKGNKQKAQEETMRLYKESGVSPLGGCLPVLAQFPILISMYAVLRAPGLEVATYQNQKAYEVTNNHLPVDSQLFADTITHEHTSLLTVNLQCSASQAGTQAELTDSEKQPVQPGKALLNDDGTPLTGEDGQTFTSKAALDCGNSATDKIVYIALLGLMIGTTFFQQRQMQKASPPGAASQQQQAILKIMPLFFGFIGFTFPAGLVLYWTTSNLFQIGQQTLLLRAGHIGPDAIEKRMAEQRAKQDEKGPPQKKGIMGSMLARAEEERKRREAADPSKPRGSAKGGSAKGGSAKGGSAKGGSARGRTGKGGARGSGSKGSGSGSGSGSAKGGGTPRPRPGGSKGSSGNPARRPKKPGSGGSDGTRG
jgi:YidC/Oxa1 family membrane protein insertase